MNNNKIQILTLAIIGSLLVLSTAFFAVDQRDYGIVFRFGKVVRVVDKAGINFKIPLIENVQFLDKRILYVNAEEKELTASDEKRVIVDAFAKYKIIDSKRFIQTVHGYSALNLRLNKMLESSMRSVIGKYPLSTLLTDQRSVLMQEIKELVKIEAKSLGIEIVDVRILKSDLPAENGEAIYARMQTEREKEAKQIRAEGEEESAKIKSKAEKESKIIKAEAYMKAEKTMGEGDAEAAKIYNAAYGKDPEFFKFYRSLIAYKNSLKQDNTQFVISPKSEFFKFLKIAN